MDMDRAILSIGKEYNRALDKFPKFPTDPIHAAAIVAEEAGELQQAALQFTYENGSFKNLKKEAVHTGAMALRFLIWLESMKKRPSKQIEVINLK